MYTKLRVIRNDVCQRKLREEMPYVFIREHICTTSPYNVGTCYGDSGGPLVTNGKLIGIVSFGIPCAKSFPDVFAKVSSFKSWIESTARQYDEENSS